MRRLITAALFLALAVPLARADEKDDAAKKLEGTYQIVSVLVGGKADDKKKDEVKSFVVKDGEITINISKGGKERAEKAKFKVDPSKKPAHFDIMPGGGDDTVPGIYETKDTDKGLELTVAFAKDGPKGERPKDFKGEGADHIVIKLLRKKEK